jgi:hypothetical protein
MDPPLVGREQVAAASVAGGRLPCMTLGSALVAPVAQQIVALETELPIPAWAFGLIAFVCLLAMMWIVLSIGKGRPHS